MNNITRILLSVCLALAAAACDDERENDNAGCDDGRDLEAVIVSIEPASEGSCDSPMTVRADFVDPATGALVASDVPAFYADSPVPRAWLDGEGIEVGTSLPAYESPWCEGGALEALADPPAC